MVYIFVAKQPLVGQGLVIEASRSHSDIQHSVGFWASDQPDADPYLTTHDIHKRHIHTAFGIRTRKPAKRAAADISGGIRKRKPGKRASADPHLSPRGHWDRVVVCINLLKPTGHVMHHQFNIQQLYALPTLYLCVLYLSENKQRLVPLTV